MIKDMLVNLSMGDKHPAIDYAASLAQINEAHLAGIAFRFDPAMQTSAFGLFPPTLVEMAIEENEQAVQKATDDFQRAAELAGISFEFGDRTGNPGGRRRGLRADRAALRSGGHWPAAAGHRTRRRSC